MEQGQAYQASKQANNNNNKSVSEVPARKGTTVCHGPIEARSMQSGAGVEEGKAGRLDPALHDIWRGCRNTNQFFRQVACREYLTLLDRIKALHLVVESCGSMRYFAPMWARIWAANGGAVLDLCGGALQGFGVSQDAQVV